MREPAADTRSSLWLLSYHVGSLRLIPIAVRTVRIASLTIFVAKSQKHFENQVTLLFSAIFEEGKIGFGYFRRMRRIELMQEKYSFKLVSILTQCLSFVSIGFSAS
jgi:hypothetical protein